MGGIKQARAAIKKRARRLTLKAGSPAGWQEFTLIDWIRRHAGPPAPGNKLGIGDDAACHAPQSGVLELVTVDALVEGVHWDFAWQPAASLGRKAVAVNLSDIAAMGGAPRRAYLALSLPKTASPAAIEDFLENFLAALRSAGVTLAGGDTVLSPGPWMIAVTVQGVAHPRRVLTRAGARPGHLLLVTGELGSAAAGLALLKKGLRPQGWETLVQRLLAPEPRLAAGQWLAARGKVSAMMDLSDGLAGDVRRLAQASRVGVRIFRDLLPISIAARMAGRALGVKPVAWALSGGEDYELLFTCPSQEAGGLIQGLRAATGLSAAIIGEVVPSRQGLRMLGLDGRSAVLPKAWEHGGETIGTNA